MVILIKHSDALFVLMERLLVQSAVWLLHERHREDIRAASTRRRQRA